MSAERARILELTAQCRIDRDALERTAKEVAALNARNHSPADGSPEAILYGYYLHQWYTAAENLLKRVAAHFGNDVEPSEWHKGLLERMKLNVPGLRPPVITQEVFNHLNAIRGFRHVFRHSYDYMLRWELMRPNVERMAAAHQLLLADIDRFLAYMDQLVERV